MSSPSLLQCVLGRLVPTQSTTEAELHAMRHRVWQEQGIAILAVSNIDDPWLRQAITNEANRLYGIPKSRSIR